MGVPRLGTRKVLVDRYEQVTDRLLMQSADDHGVRLLAKMRMADVIDISGLSGSTKTYALQAHFDFVMVDEAADPLFAVEFDGVSHLRDRNVGRRDRLKDEICDAAGLPLLRITSAYFAKVAQSTVLQYAVDAYFLSEAFYQAQLDGLVPWDEPFDVAWVLRSTDREEIVLNSLDAEARIALSRHQEAGRIPHRCPDVSVITVPDGGMVDAFAYMAVTKGQYLVSHVRIRSFQFQGIVPGEIAEELAVIEIAAETERWLAGEPAAWDWRKLRDVFQTVQAAIDHDQWLRFAGSGALSAGGDLPVEVGTIRLQLPR